MSNIPIKDILFIRKYPRFLEKKSHLKKQFQSIISSRGATTRYLGHDITFLFFGYGKKQRIPHPTIIEKLNSGKITDIVDIGGGGALDPTLKRVHPTKAYFCSWSARILSLKNSMSRNP